MPLITFRWPGGKTDNPNVNAMATRILGESVFLTLLASLIASLLIYYAAGIIRGCWFMFPTDAGLRFFPNFSLRTGALI